MRVFYVVYIFFVDLYYIILKIFMKQIKFYHLIILSTLIIYTINSCNTIYEKNDYIPLEAEVARITESEQAINVVEDIAITAENALINELNSTTEHKSGTCATHTLRTTDQTLTSTFTANCVGIEGFKRTGTLTTSYSGTPRVVGKNLLVDFTNFKYDSVTITGKVLFSYDTILGGFLNCKILATDVILTYPSGKTTKVSLDRKWKLVSGSLTTTLYDDVWQIDGNASGLYSDNKSYYSYTTTSNLYNTACWSDGVSYPISGKHQYNSGLLNFALLDYGKFSDCDNKVDLYQTDVKNPHSINFRLR